MKFTMYKLVGDSKALPNLGLGRAVPLPESITRSGTPKKQSTYLLTTEGIIL